MYILIAIMYIYICVYNCWFFFFFSFVYLLLAWRRYTCWLKETKRHARAIAHTHTPIRRENASQYVSFEPNIFPRALFNFLWTISLLILKSCLEQSKIILSNRIYHPELYSLLLIWSSFEFEMEFKFKTEKQQISTITMIVFDGDVQWSMERLH